MKEAGIKMRDEIMKILQGDNPFAYSPKEVLPLQLEVAHRLFLDMRPNLPILGRRAIEGGIEGIASLEDIVPLLLAHTTYKTYPQSFVINKQWKRLSKWISVVSTHTFDDVDVEDAKDIDDYIERFAIHGYTIVTSSGTGGKVSLLPKNERDISLYRTFVQRFGGQWPACIEPDQSRHFFQFGPIKGALMAVQSAICRMENFARPDSRHILIEEPLLISEVSYMAEVREKMKAGIATPQEIRNVDSAASAQRANSEARFGEMVDLLVELRNEPVYIMAGAAQMYELVQRLRDLGVPDGSFHSGSVISSGGGVKHFKLPSDWEAQVHRFFGNVIYSRAYGMSEMTWACVSCPAGHYHLPPTLIPLVLDEQGEKLVAPHAGLATGRFGFLDLMTQIRWGGTISGDKVTIDLEGNCPCGYQSPNVRSIGRYIDLKGEDKIQCAGTIDAYIRGAVVE